MGDAGRSRARAVFIFGAFIVAVIVGVWIGSNMLRSPKYVLDPKQSASPVFAVRVTVPPAAREPFFAAVDEFAKQNTFSFHVRRLADTNVFQGNAMRGDLWISIWNPLDPSEFTIRMYPPPTKSVDVKTAAAMFELLRARVSAVPGVRFLEETPGK